MPLDTREINLRLGTLDSGVRERMNAIAGYVGEEMAGYAKKNAPWADRTANARNGLHSVVVGGENEVKSIVSHGVDYGIWLEIAHGGQYSIIPASVEYGFSEAMELVSRIFRDIP